MMITNLFSNEKTVSTSSHAGKQFNEDLALVKIVHSTNLMKEVSDEMYNLTQVSVNNRMKLFKKKKNIFSDGDAPHYLYFLSKGKVKTFKSHEYGKELIINLFKDGDFLGHNALIEKKRYSESAETLEDSEICLIPKEDFLNLMNNNIYVMRKFMDILANDIVEKKNQLVNLAYSSLRKRVAEALVYLQKKYDNTKGKNFSISLCRADLAKIAGTSQESIIRTLSEFKKEKLIEIISSRISIVDLEKLEKLRA